MSDYKKRRLVMVDTQIRVADVTSFPIIEAMLDIPREDFVPAALREVAYAGENLPVGPGRTILDPRTLAKMLNALAIRPGQLVLDIGCAMGYSSAVIARLAEAVVAVEEDEALAREAEAGLAEIGSDNVAVICAPLTEGAPQHGPYDAIVFEGAVEHIPDALIDQLAEGGRIGALFFDGRLGVARVGYKIDGLLSWRDSFHASAPVMPGFAAKREFAF